MLKNENIIKKIEEIQPIKNPDNLENQKTSKKEEDKTVEYVKKNSNVLDEPSKMKKANLKTTKVKNTLRNIV